MVAVRGAKAKTILRALVGRVDAVWRVDQWEAVEAIGERYDRRCTSMTGAAGPALGLSGWPPASFEAWRIASPRQAAPRAASPEISSFVAPNVVHGSQRSSISSRLLPRLRRSGS